jgi:uncharacterized coiled-coil DUF342 family protein
MSNDRYDELLQKTIDAPKSHDKDRSIETLIEIRLEIVESHESLTPEDTSALIRQVDEFIKTKKIAKWRELYDSSDKKSLEQMERCKSELESINNEYPGDSTYKTTMSQIKNKIESLKMLSNNKQRGLI